MMDGGDYKLISISCGEPCVTDVHVSIARYRGLSRAFRSDQQLVSGVQLIDGGATIPLCALADQAETFQRHARKIDGFRRNVEPVHGCRMSDDRLDHADIDPEGHRFGALVCTHLAVVDQLLPVEVTDLLLAQIALERRERGGLGPRRGGFPTLHISVI